MCKKILYILTFLVFCINAEAKRVHYAACDTVVLCTEERWHEVMTEFFYLWETDPNQLFQWAFKGTEEQETDPEKKKSENSKDAIELSYDAEKYDAQCRASDWVINAKCLGVPVIRGGRLHWTYTDCRTTDDEHQHLLRATYSGNMVENLDLQFRIKQLPKGQLHIHFEFNLLLGRFISIFVSDKMWHSAAEWRLLQMCRNIILHANYEL